MPLTPCISWILYVAEIYIWNLTAHYVKWEVPTKMIIPLHWNLIWYLGQLKNHHIEYMPTVSPWWACEPAIWLFHTKFKKKKLPKKSSSNFAFHLLFLLLSFLGARDPSIIFSGCFVVSVLSHLVTPPTLSARKHHFLLQVPSGFIHNIFYKSLGLN